MVSGIKMNLNTQTKVQDLVDFSKDLKDGRTLKAKQNKDGTFTLWASKDKSSIFDGLTGKAQRRGQQQNLANREMLKIFEGGDYDHARTASDIKTLMTNDKVTHGDKKITTEALKVLAGWAELHSNDGPDMSGYPKVTDGLQFRNAINPICNKLVNGEADIANFSDEIDALAKVIADDLDPTKKSDVSPPPIFNPAKYLGEVMGHITEGIHDQAMIDMAQDCVDEAMLRAERLHFGDCSQATDGSEKVTINGTEYAKKEKLGGGGFGTAYRFEATDGSGKSIAIKFPNDSKLNTPENEAKALLEFQNEIGQQMRAAQSGHDKIIGFVGAFKTDNGQMAIATELAANGTASQALDKLQDMVDNGNCPKEAAEVIRLTILKDMVEGMKDLHENAGMTHIDFKPHNAFVSEDGTCKVADFGGSVMTENPTLNDIKDVENPIWKGVTALYESKSGQGVENVRQQAYDGSVDTICKQFFPQFIDDNGQFDMDAAKESDRGIARFIDQIGKAASDTAKTEYLEQTQFSGVGYDMYALGVTAVNVVLGEDTLATGTENLMLSGIENQMMGFVEEGVNAIGTHQGAIRPPTGDNDLDDLVNSLTHPDVSQRPDSFDDVLNKPIFNRPLVGSDEAHQLFAALLNGDTDTVSDVLLEFDKAGVTT